MSVASLNKTPKKTAYEATGIGVPSPGHEPQPHVHLTTYLAIFSVCLVYVAQNFAIVGAGAVS